MALWSLFVEVGAKRFSTQVRASTPKAAVAQLLRRGDISAFTSGPGFANWPASFSAKDIIGFTRMEPLINMYLCQLGRGGKYVSITLARTVSRA